MMKIVLTSILFLFCLPAVGVDLNLQYKEPEEALLHYIDGLRMGDVRRIEEIYLPRERDEFQFYLPGPISIHHVELNKKKIFTEDMVAEYVALPKPKVGDIELEVKQYMGPTNECFMYTYILRKVRGGWYILSNAAWDQP